MPLGFDILIEISIMITQIEREIEIKLATQRVGEQIGE